MFLASRAAFQSVLRLSLLRLLLHSPAGTVAPQCGRRWKPELPQLRLQGSMGTRALERRFQRRRNAHERRQMPLEVTDRRRRVGIGRRHRRRRMERSRGDVYLVQKRDEVLVQRSGRSQCIRWCRNQRRALHWSLKKRVGLRWTLEKRRLDWSRQQASLRLPVGTSGGLRLGVHLRPCWRTSRSAEFSVCVVPGPPPARGQLAGRCFDAGVQLMGRLFDSGGQLMGRLFDGGVQLMGRFLDSGGQLMARLLVPAEPRRRPPGVAVSSRSSRRVSARPLAARLQTAGVMFCTKCGL